MKQTLENSTEVSNLDGHRLAFEPVLGTVAALFVKKDSVYKTLGVDCWDIDRDATKWPGGAPCVAHPPCRAWGQLSHFAKPRPGEKELAFFAIEMIRKYGGVLEHPRASRLWPEHLPLPGSFDKYGGYSICVDQSWWGHRAKKNTLLYIVGCSQRELPEIPLRFDAIEYTVASKIKKNSGRRIKKEIPKSERESTPIEFAKWLIEVASRCVGSYCT